MKASKSAKRGAAKGRAHEGRVERKATAKVRGAARKAGGTRRAVGAKVGAKSSAGRTAGVRTRAAPPAKQEVELEAAVLRRLLRHFDERKDVQNIELMILAGFCRNCLSRWFVEAAQERGVEVDIERARAKVYGMPYSEWKERHQPPATEDQLRRFGEAEQRKQAVKGSAAKGSGARNP